MTAAIKNTGRTDSYYPVYFPRWQSIPHYYGDLVRQFFLAAVALMLFTAPFYAESFTVQMPFIVVGALVLIALAALTNPRGKAIMMLNAVAAGVGLIMYEAWALFQYRQDDYIALVLLEGCALIFLFAFYFSMKTWRAMMMNMVGKDADNNEFGATAGEAREPDEDAGAVGMHIESDPDKPAIDGIGEIAAEADDKGDN